jgi:hypothetical protein
MVFRIGIRLFLTHSNSIALTVSITGNIPWCKKCGKNNNKAY